MQYEQIVTDVADGVLTITLNRPDRLNAWTAHDGRGADRRVRSRPMPTTPCGW